MPNQSFPCIQTNHLRPSTGLANGYGRKGGGGLLAAAGLFATLWTSSLALAATAPPLGAAQAYAVLAGSAVTNTGSSVLAGEMGISPGNSSSVTGFPPGSSGATHFADAAALAAQTSTATAYNQLAGQPVAVDLTGQDLGGLRLFAGVYNFSTSAQLTGTLTLDAQGDPNAVFVFKTGSTLTTASSSVVQVINSGQSCNVFWQVGSAAILGTGTSFVGNILALDSITMNTGASLNGRALARNGAVTLDTNAVSACQSSVTPAVSSIPSLSEWGLIMLASLTTIAGLIATRRLKNNVTTKGIL